MHITVNLDLHHANSNFIIGPFNSREILYSEIMRIKQMVNYRMWPDLMKNFRRDC